MNDLIRFTDAITAHALVDKGATGKKYITTKDSASPSGHSLITQIEMTHAGIVTRNLGFYLPSNTRKGAPSFYKDYKKPVLVGHNSDSDPVGRVIDAKYIDTSKQWTINDRYLNSMMEFVDKKKSAKKDDVVDFAQHVMKEYHGKDGYRGLGNITGTLKITDEEAIQKILDERYLTVSISMSSTSALCSECGQDWISEGMCDHERGQIYDSGLPVVLIPGDQSYNHVGIVSEPADVYAAGFKGIELIKDGAKSTLDSVIQVSEKHLYDEFSIAANLFTYQDSKLISLSDKTATDLIEVKESIQRLEDSLKTMENLPMKKKGTDFSDSIRACISLYKGDLSTDESTDVTIVKYVSELSEEMISEMAKKAAAALDSSELESESDLKDAVANFLKQELSSQESINGESELGIEVKDKVMKSTKTLNQKFKVTDGEEYEASAENSVLSEIQKIEGISLTAKEAKELASLIVKSQHNDAIASLTLDASGKTIEDCVKTFIEIKDTRFKLSSVSAEDIVEKMNTYLPENLRISSDAFLEIAAKDCAGSGKYFPITSRETAEAAKRVLGLIVASDSLKGRILEGISKLSSKYATEEKAIESVDKKLEDASANFDSSTTECNNLTVLTDEALQEQATKLLALAQERELLGSIIKPYIEDKEQEIAILEHQLLTANDEIDSLLTELSLVKDEKKTFLAEKVVDAKIKIGLCVISDRESEIQKHFERSEDSLKDMLSDFKKASGVQISDSEKIKNPVLQDQSDNLNKQIEDVAKINQEASNKMLKEKTDSIMKTYNLLKINKGKVIADRWLAQQGFLQ